MTIWNGREEREERRGISRETGFLPLETRFLSYAHHGQGQREMKPSSPKVSKVSILSTLSATPFGVDTFGMGGGNLSIEWGGAFVASGRVT
jgi:hypothetical protein